MRISGIVAAVVFAVSCLIGLLTGASPLLLILRAAVLAIVYFGAVEGARRVIGRFLGDIWPVAGETAGDAAMRGGGEEIGNRVDFSVGDDGVEGRIVGAAGDETELAIEAGDIADKNGSKSQKGLDQGNEGRYTEAEYAGAASVSQASGVQAAKPPDNIGKVDVLPDLEGFSDSFATSYSRTGNDEDGVEPEMANSEFQPTIDRSERFDPTEMASAIRTLLKKDQKG